MKTDRGLSNPPNLRAHFVRVIERNLKLSKLPYPSGGLFEFADWIYETPNRCPAIRLVYEVWHKITKNKTDPLDDSDMEDLMHLSCLPYVDFMTVDRRMHGYVTQASKGLCLPFQNKISKSAQDILSRL